MILLLFLFSAFTAETKKVCAPKDGASFTLECKLVTVEEAKKLQAAIDAKKKIKPQITVEVGQYSGRPGYYVLVDQKPIDVMVMTANAIEALEQNFKNVNLGETLHCKLEGKQQATVYSIFFVEKCDKK
jgi:hypothetical protein